MTKISFLIPVYNQSDDLKKCISSITGYNGKDIEIVVSDDDSVEDLETVIESFHDNRIKHIKNSKNLGLDGNMLFGMENCSGEYIFLLRTRDYIIADSISKMIDVIDTYPEVVCISGSCIDDDGLLRLCFMEKLYKRGEEALHAHYSLQFHPSGMAFRKALIDTERIRKYMSEFTDPRMWFMADQLIRLGLTSMGDFYLIAAPIWIYTYTNRNNKKSVHRISNESIYSPRLTRNRFRSEIEYVCNEIDPPLQELYVRRSIQYWLYQATVAYKTNAEDKALQKHYGYKAEIVDINKERSDFLMFSETLFREMKLYLKYADAFLKGVQCNIQSVDAYENSKRREKEVIMLSQSVVNRLTLAGGAHFTNYLRKNGIKKVGIYGAGYLGRIVWNLLRKEPNVDISYICDKKYFTKIRIDDGVYAIPPKDMLTIDVDLCLVTPIQSYDEMAKSVPKGVNYKSIQECCVW